MRLPPMMRLALIPVKEKEEWASNIFSRAVLYKGNVIITSTPPARAVEWV